jgi:hypothetical protein
MSENQTTPAGGLIRHRLLRCLLAALLCAGLSTTFVGLFGWIGAGQQAYFFILILIIGMFSAHVHERIVQLAR